MASPLVGTELKWLAGKSECSLAGRDTSMLSLAGRIQVCFHWLAGYKYAPIGWQVTSMSLLAGRIQICSHWLRGHVSGISFADWKHS
jgi:hypothetical protein